MRKPKNVREALEELEEVNNPRNRFEYATSEDVQAVNYDTIAVLCDLLGMSDIYLRGKRHEVSKCRCQ